MCNPYHPPGESSENSRASNRILRGCLVDVVQLVIVGLAAQVGYAGPLFVSKLYSGGNATLGGGYHAISMITGPLAVVVAIVLAMRLNKRK